MPEEAARDASIRRIAEAIEVLRYKDVRSTTLERMRVTLDADLHVRGLPQPLQFGEGLYHLLDHISVPVARDDLILGRITEEIPDAEGEAFYRATLERWGDRPIPPWMVDGGHECFAWDRLIDLGFAGLEGYAQDELIRRTGAGEEQSGLDFLRGAVLAMQAFRNYAARYSAAAQAAGLDTQAAVCSALADGPPRTFTEALQLIWLVGHVFCTMLAQNATLTFGRMDELLLAFYREDLSEGTLTPDSAGDLIEDFYCKNNLILGRGEHQMSGQSEKATGWQRNLCYDAPQYIVIGGRRSDGALSANELTRIFLERITPRFENPVVVLRYTDDLPEPIWRIACDKMRLNASMLVYNDHDVINALESAGIEGKDAVGYTMHGCNWPDIPGIQRLLKGSQVPLPEYFLEALLGAEGEPEPVLSTLEDVYERFVGIFRRDMRNTCNEFRTMRRRWRSEGPGFLRMDDCFFEGPVRNARSAARGGVKYGTMVCAIGSIATAADSFAAIDELVFSSNQVPLDRLRLALGNNFAEDEALRQACLHAPKFGQDNDAADRHAVRILDTILEELEKVSRLGSEDAVIIFPCLETDMGHRRIGARTGATPDGRLAGLPTSENTSPSPGACVKGLTAMLRSVTKLPLSRITSGALNIRLQSLLTAGEAGLDLLAVLLRTYFDTGGLQAQLTVADFAELRDAQTHPEQHRDLMVRITGYSAVFVDMEEAAQDEIIRRAEMGVL